MFSDHSESGSFKQKKFGYVDSDNNSHINSEMNGNDEEFKEFLDYILINIEKYETKIKEAYENIQNSFENPENLGVLTNKFDFYIEREDKFLDKINNLKSKIEYMRERKKDLKLEFNNLIKDFEHKKYRLLELEQENVNVINENLHLKSEINEMKEQMTKNEKSEDKPASVNHIDLHAIINEKQIIINEKNNLKKRIEDYETQLNAITHRSKEDHQKIISLEIEKRNLHYKNKTLEMKMNTILKELEEMRRINENLNIENMNLRNEMTSNSENPNDENKRANTNNGLNLHSFLDEQYVKQNSNILNMREIFKKCNTLKKKFSQKCTTMNNYNNQKALKTISRDHSSGSRNSNISARVIDNKQKNSTSELNGFSRSHIPLPPRKIATLKRIHTTKNIHSNHIESSNNENKEILNLQKTINDTNLSFNDNLIANNNDELNYLNEYSNNYNCLTLGNIENSPREKSEDKKMRKHSNLVLKNNKSEANKNLVNADSIFEDKEKNKFLENKRQSSKTNKTVNGRVSFNFIEGNKPKTFLKEDDMVSKIKRFSSGKNTNHVLNAGHYHYHDYKNFFYLTYESIKHNTTKTHIFEEIDVDNLYKHALIHSIPFYKYNKYIKTEIKGMLGKYQEDETKTEKVVNSVMNFFEIFLNMK